MNPNAELKKVDALNTLAMYDSYTLFKEVESGRREVPDVIRLKFLQLLLACATLENGEWVGQSPFFVLNTLEQVTREDIVAAKQLEEPELTLHLRNATILLFTIKKVRNDLQEQLGDDFFPDNAA